MKREDLKKIEGLTDEQINSIMNLHQADVTTWTSKLTVKENELKAEQGKVASLTADLDKFKDVDIEALKNAKSTYEAEKQKMIDDHAKEIGDMKFNSALELKIRDTKTVDPVGLKAHLDTSKLKYNEETKSIDGLDEQVKSIKETFGYLFNAGATGGSHGGLEGDEGGSNVSLGSALKDHYNE